MLLNNHKMLKLVTSNQIREFESELIKKQGSNYSLELMEKAGSGLAKCALSFNDPFIIICGKGNNGGDGLVAARYLCESGKRVIVILTSDESKLTQESKENLKRIKDKIQYLKVTEETDKNFTEVLNSSNTILECLLGTGVKGKLNPLYAWIIRTISKSGKKIIACDIPTGIDPDTGNISEFSVKAEMTVTFGFAKQGMLIYPAKKYVGELKTIDIGLPDIKTQSFLMDNKFVKENLPGRTEDSNKGSFGRTLLICGSNKYPGAALLASKAASSIGSGLAALSSPESVFSQITSGIPEVTHVNFVLDEIIKESTKSSVIVIGPGLTTEKNIENLVKSLIVSVDIPIVLDADGINVIAGEREIIKKAKNEVIITPHPKEFARLLGLTVNEVLNNKIGLVKDTAKKLNCTIVLKGPGTIIATKDEKLYVSPFANSALAKGGTGDVLAGFIGGLISQGLKPEIAACVGVYLHGKSAELVSIDKTVFSLLPQDLIQYLPHAIQSI